MISCASGAPSETLALDSVTILREGCTFRTADSFLVATASSNILAVTIQTRRACGDESVIVLLHGSGVFDNISSVIYAQLEGSIAESPTWLCCTKLAGSLHLVH